MADFDSSSYAVSEEDTLDFPGRKASLQDLTIAEGLQVVAGDALDKELTGELQPSERTMSEVDFAMDLYVNKNQKKVDEVLTKHKNVASNNVLISAAKGQREMTAVNLKRLKNISAMQRDREKFKPLDVSGALVDKTLKGGVKLLETIQPVVELSAQVLSGFNQSVIEYGKTIKEVEEIRDRFNYPALKYNLEEAPGQTGIIGFAANTLDNIGNEIYRTQKKEDRLPLTEKEEEILNHGTWLESMQVWAGQENVLARAMIGAVQAYARVSIPGLLFPETMQNFADDPNVQGTAAVAGNLFISPGIMPVAQFTRFLYNTSKASRVFGKSFSGVSARTFAGMDKQQAISEYYMAQVGLLGLVGPNLMKKFRKDVKVSVALEEVSNLDIFARDLGDLSIDITRAGFRSGVVSASRQVASVGTVLRGQNKLSVLNQGALSIEWGALVRNKVLKVMNQITEGVSDKTLTKITSFARQFEGRSFKVTPEHLSGKLTDEEQRIYFAIRALRDEEFRLANDTYVRDLDRLGVVTKKHEDGTIELLKVITKTKVTKTVHPFSFVEKTKKELEDDLEVITNEVFDRDYRKLEQGDKVIPYLNNFFAPVIHNGDYVVSQVTKTGADPIFKGTSAQAEEFEATFKKNNPGLGTLVHLDTQNPTSLVQLNNYLKKGKYLNSSEATKVQAMLEEIFFLSKTESASIVTERLKPNVKLRPFDRALARSKSFNVSGMSGNARHIVLTEDGTDIEIAFPSRKEAEKYIKDTGRPLEYVSDFGTAVRKISEKRPEVLKQVPENFDDLPGITETMTFLQATQHSVSQLGRLTGKGSFSTLINKSYMESVGKRLNKIGDGKFTISHFTDEIPQYLRNTVDFRDTETIAFIDNARWLRNVLRHTAGLPKEQEISASLSTNNLLSRFKNLAKVKSVALKLSKSERKYLRNVAKFLDHSVNMKQWSNAGRSGTSFSLMGASYAAGALQMSQIIATLFRHAPFAPALTAKGMRDLERLIVLRGHYKATGGIRTTDEGLAFMREYDVGYIGEIEVQEFGTATSGLARKGFSVPKLAEGTFNLAFTPIRQGEWLNRAFAYSVSLQRIKHKVKKEKLNWNLQKIKDEAVIMAKQTAQDYSPADDPAFARGGLTAFLASLKKFWCQNRLKLCYLEICP